MYEYGWELQTADICKVEVLPTNFKGQKQYEEQKNSNTIFQIGGGQFPSRNFTPILFIVLGNVYIQEI